jgi:ankyrin repeat protein
MDDGSNEKSALHMQILNRAFANMQALVQYGCSSISTNSFPVCEETLDKGTTMFSETTEQESFAATPTIVDKCWFAKVSGSRVAEQQLFVLLFSKY